MHRALLLWASLLVGDVHDYSRPLDAKKLDQATLDAEAYGEKKVIKRENDGLRITLAPGDAETGWKTPQALKIGGDFTITASFVVHKLPKPAQEDGVAVGAVDRDPESRSARSDARAPDRDKRLDRLSLDRQAGE